VADSLGTGIATLWTANGPDRDPYFRKVTGNLAVAHALARRLITSTGTLSWTSDGYDIRRLLNDGIPANTRGPLLAIAAFIRAECRKDERVADASVDVSVGGESRDQLVIAIDVTTADGPFRLVLLAKNGLVSILSLTGTGV
jgi:hypothetical protein